ncbi:MAG: hypothetical protein ACT4PT_07250 [Methanobacteriota archaeon]
MVKDELAPHAEDIARALGNRVSVEEIAEELQKYLDYGVALPQAKRDIVRNRGGTLGRASQGQKKLADLSTADANVDLLCKILSINPKAVTVGGEAKTIFYGLVADESCVLPYTAWRDFGLAKGDTVRVHGAYVTSWRDEAQVNLGDRTQVERTTDVVNVLDARRPPKERTVKDLAAGQNNVSLSVRILAVARREVMIQEKPREIFSGELADGTGKCRFTAWKDFGLVDGAPIRIQGAYVKAFRGIPDLNLGDLAAVERLPDDALPPVAELGSDRPGAIGELAEVGGAQGAVVEGRLLEVKEGSGLIFRCPQCNRVVQKRECRVHGKVEGTPDLRVKGVLDDGTGALTVFIGRAATEGLIGKSLEECRRASQDAMSTEVIVEEIADQLAARRLRVVGNVTSDDYGLMLMADRASLVAAPAVEREAERLLETVAPEAA